MQMPDGWTPVLETGYQKYVIGKQAKNLHARDRDGWREAVNRWAHLKQLGDNYRDSIYTDLGCLRERGYSKELHKNCAPLGARRLDIAAEELRIAFEIKYGATNAKDARAQLDKDALSLTRDQQRVMVWIVQDIAKMPREVRERQQDLEKQFPGRFFVMEASPPAHERVMENIREMLRAREAAREQDRIGRMTDQLEMVRAERERNPEQEREMVWELAQANERWLQIDRELSEVRAQRAEREHALDQAVEQEQYRRALALSPHERDLLRERYHEVREIQLAEREAHARIWQTELQGLARREHQQALAARQAGERGYRELEQQVRERLQHVAIEPVNREQLRDAIERAAHHERVLAERTGTELSALTQHLDRHISQERAASGQEHDSTRAHSRENVAAAIEHTRNRYQSMAQGIDREAFLAWTEVGRDESRVRHYEKDGRVLTEITRTGKDPVTVAYDSKERELALAVTLAREGKQPTMIANECRASRDSALPPGFALARQHEFDREREHEAHRQRERQRGRERER